jgi:cell division septation protein DedD
MRDPRVAIFLLAAALPGCGGQSVPPASRHLPANIATPPSDAPLLRVSRSGGSSELLRATTLAVRPGSEISGIPPISHMLGASGFDDQTVYGTDNGGRLVAIDFRSQRARLVPSAARQLASSPDGTILGVDSARRPIRLIDRVFTTYKVPVDKGTLLLRGPGEQVLAVGNRPGMLEVLSSGGEVRHLPIPAGRVAATWVGDLVAVVTDSGVVFVDPSGKPPTRKSPPRFVRVKGSPTVAAFSPSGHRLYLARKHGGLVMIDRFTRQILKELPLDGTADALRADRNGRWLLAHAASGDSLWAIDVTRWAIVWHGSAPWAEDLPRVINDHSLLVRRRNDVVAIDLTSDTPATTATVVGGASDLYFLLPWALKGTAAPPRIDVATAPATRAGGPPGDSATAARAAAPVTNQPTPAAGGAVLPPPTAAAAAATPAAAPATSATGTIYVQVSASQNSDWAQALAKQLKDGGFPARVLDPKTSDESYRVVVGPYASHEDADAVGKRLGRPYFIITSGSGDT